MNVDKLDDAFLFVLGLGILGFAIVEGSIKDSSWLYDAIPVLIAGVGFPFYVGYVRGALNDSVIERMRGWIYLLVGYFVTLAILLMSLGYLKPLGSYEEAGFIMITLPGLLIARYVARRMLRAFPLESSLKTRVILVGGAVAAFLSPLLYVIALLLFSIVPSVGAAPSLGVPLLGVVWIVLFLSIIYIGAEHTCQALYWEGTDQTLRLDRDQFRGQKGMLCGLLRASEFDLLLHFAFFTILPFMRLRLVALFFGGIVLVVLPTSLHLGLALSGVSYLGADILECALIVSYLRISRTELVSSMPHWYTVV